MSYFILVLLLLFPGHRSMIAVETAAATMKQGQKEKVPRSECTMCNGTGKVKAGDGQTIVYRDCTNCYPEAEAKCPCKDGEACICGPDCKCKDCPCKKKPAVADRKLLYFGATWCAPCKLLKNRFKAIGHEPKADGEFQYIDIDDHPDLKNQYKVGPVPTIILLENGKELKRWIGLQDPKAVWSDFKPNETVEEQKLPQSIREERILYRYKGKLYPYNPVKR